MRSQNYKIWISLDDPRRCSACEEKQGQAYEAHSEKLNLFTKGDRPPLHLRCRCRIQWMEAKRAGTATDIGLRGADWWLKTFQKLPDYYITEAEAEALGWENRLGNLRKVAPGKMLQKGVYQNRDHHLPEAPGRVWYEADINYTGGFRGADRILYSNDGLIFVTYDHYKTFVEII